MKDDIIKAVAEKVGYGSRDYCFRMGNTWDKVEPCDYSCKYMTADCAVMCKHFRRIRETVDWLKNHATELAAACFRYLRKERSEMQERFANHLLSIVRERVHPATKMHEAFILATPEDKIEAFHKAFCA